MAEDRWLSPVSVLFSGLSDCKKDKTFLVIRRGLSTRYRVGRSFFVEGALKWMRGTALDIGGTRARLLRFEASVVTGQSELWLPKRDEGESVLQWGHRRVEAIVELLSGWQFLDPDEQVATSCAGRKDAERESVTESNYASPLPNLVKLVRKSTGREIGPLFDDDVCAGWGHLQSPIGGLNPTSGPTILLTAGTGLAESLWVDGKFLAKGTYPRVYELGLEEALRTDAWRAAALPLEALRDLVKARAALAPFQRIVLSGRFAAPDLLQVWPKELMPGVDLEVYPLEEGPALGALVLKS